MRYCICRFHRGKTQKEETNMKNPKLTLAAIAAVAAAVGIWGIQALNAQQSGLTRVPLQDLENITVPGRHVVQARAEFAPGAEIGKHTHPGEEISYVLEGAL